MENRGGYYPGLDSLRGVAILAVVGYHAWAINPGRGPWAHVVSQGNMGVGLFFILSALTLALIWDRYPSPLHFWIRRFFRIAPLYYLVLLLVALLTGPVDGRPLSLGPGDILAHVFFGFGLIPAWQDNWIHVEWSIGVEMLFYAGFPWLIRAVRRIRSRWGAFILLAGSYCLAWGSYALLSRGLHLPTSYALFFVLTQAPWLVGGLLMAGRWNEIRCPRRYLALGWVAGVFLLIDYRPPYIWQPLAWAPFLGVFCWGVFRGWPGWGWIGRSRALQWIGRRSYGWYLWHFPALLGLARLGPAWDGAGFTSWALRALAAGTLSALLSELSGRMLEDRAREWGRALGARLSGDSVGGLLEHIR